MAATRGDMHYLAGWVPETFFSGGGNNERDSRLLIGAWC